MIGDGSFQSQSVCHWVWLIGWWIFTQKGADVNASAGGGVTPLHVAADRGDERMVDCLLAAGADPNAMDDVNYLICHSSVLVDARVWAVYQLIITSSCQMLASPLLYLIVFCWSGVLCKAAKWMKTWVCWFVVQEDAKPIHAAAAKEFRSVVERLLPLSTPDPSVADWTVDGLLAHADRLAAQEEVFNNTFMVICGVPQSCRCKTFQGCLHVRWCGFSSVIDLLQASYQGLKEAREKVKEEKPIPAEVYARFLYMHFDMKAWTQCSPLKNILCLAILYACPNPDETVCVACLCMPYRLHLKRSKQHWNLRPEAMRLSRRKITCLQLMHTHRSLIIFCFPTEKVCNECCMFFLQ